MKIIQQGTPPPKPWWVGLTLNCGCGAVVELEDGDCVTDYSDMRGYGQSNESSVRCPSCNQRITFRNPVGRFVPQPVPQWLARELDTYTTSLGTEP